MDEFVLIFDHLFYGAHPVRNSGGGDGSIGYSVEVALVVLVEEREEKLLP